MNYRKTVNLPATAFPMKANLRQREPQFQKRWADRGLYPRIRKARQGAKVYILHDGPPYASGDLHIGTGLNKVLKDLAVRSRTMMGYDAPYVPGWDCHGLPIEHRVLQELGDAARGATRAEIRRRCRDFAERHTGAHIEQFQRLGVLGDFDHPYMTLAPEYERAVIELLADLVEKGFVYKRLKPIHWDYEARTALAEAELEYEDVQSPSIYVEFPMAQGVGDLFPDLGDQGAALLIWTTTPWTLPANRAIALAEMAEYTAVRCRRPGASSDQVLILAEDLVETVMEATGIADYQRAGRCRGKDLEGRTYRHVLTGQPCPVVLAPYVSLEDGTGCVHTAPGHGREDYETGLANGLEIFSPVDEAGRLTEEAGEFAGLHVFEADPKIVERLEELGVLLAADTITHSYPHGWRSKKPVIFRATEQWFVSVDHEHLRQRMLQAIEEVHWVPAWGQERIASMVAERPDWCISRQRAWGVPIPALYCTACGGVLLTRESVLAAAALFGRRGSDAWFEAEPADFLPQGTACPECGGTAFRKESDILDVWFESGSSHRAVLRTTEGLRWPADLYLEGTDQHRGWFQLSMLTAVAAEGRAPYKGVVTHGFVVDEQGEKMSKSLGNFISVEEALRDFGAELLRLWSASVDYRNEINASPAIIRRLEEPYRRFRNTFRFLLGNLHDFDPATDTVDPDADLRLVDAWALARTGEVVAEVREAYESYQFYRVYQRLYRFCTVDLSSFYFDVIKDRLYCEAPDSPARRSAQTVLAHILDALVRVLAPILVHTCEEAWDAMPWEKEEDSVHLALFPWIPPAEEARRERVLDLRLVPRVEQLAPDWSLLFEVREEVARRLETLRAEKKIGSGLDARVVLYARDATRERLATFGEKTGEEANALAEVLLVSEAELRDTQEGADASPGERVPAVRLAVGPSERAKCARCWRRLSSVGEDAEHDDLCERCARVVRSLAPQEGDAE
ncbi:MAG: isoleucine--tRNA ligase [Candidatus Brocadiia bacterium]